MPGADNPSELERVGYRVVDEVGRGGFGTVYRAEQSSVGREVAVKVLLETPDEWSRVRFERECKALGRLSWHPHIVVVYDAGVTESGLPYLSMEFLDGGNLAEAVRQAGKGIAPDEVTSIGVQLAGALAAAHAGGVLHRDVKPGNVLFGNFGEAKLTDFGIARLSDSEVTRNTGDFTGTVAYSAPEVLSGEEPTELSDVYSLGALLFALLTGRPAFSSRDRAPAAVVSHVLNDPVPDLRPQGVPAALCAAIESAMAKSPTDRPLSAEAFGVMLQQAQSIAGEIPDRLIVGRRDTRHAPAPPPVEAEENDPSQTIPRQLREPAAKKAAVKKMPAKKKAAAKNTAAKKAAAKKAPARKAAKKVAVTPVPEGPVIVAAPAVIEREQSPLNATPAKASRPWAAALALVVAVAVASGIGAGAGRLVRDNENDSTTTTSTSAAPTVFTLPSGAAESLYVSGIPLPEPRLLTLRDAPNGNALGDFLNGEAGVVSVDPSPTTVGSTRWQHVRGRVVLRDGTVAEREGWSALKYLKPANIGPTQEAAAALMRELGYEPTAVASWHTDGLSAVVANAGDTHRVFFFAAGVYVGAEAPTPMSNRIEIVGIDGIEATIRYSGTTVDVLKYRLDSLPIHRV